MKISSNIEKITTQLFVKNFLTKFPKANMYLVGGSVRDAILGLESADIDLVCEGIFDNELTQFLEKEGQITTIKGRAFGILKFRPRPPLNLPLEKGEKVELVYDIALPRREEYSPGQRRKDATVELKNVSILDDLSRRDFTVNAMAVNLRMQIDKSKVKSSKSKVWNGYSLIDPFDGLADLEDGILRAVGKGEERFAEDPTRILRGIRFAVQFNFEIEKNSLSAMQKMAPEIIKKFKIEGSDFVQRVSNEMIGLELMKSLTFNPKITIEWYDKVGLLPLLLPEIEAQKGVEQPPQFHSEGDVYVHTLLSLSRLQESASFAVKLATLLHDIGKTETFKSAEETGDRIRFNNHDMIGAEMARDVCQRLHYSNEITDEVVWIIQNHIKLFFSFLKMGREKQKQFVRNKYFADLLILAKADTLASFFANGKPQLGLYPEITKLADELLDEDRGRPIEIMSGKMIIGWLKEQKFQFDAQKHGEMIGALKKKINTLYDRGEIKSGKEAYEILARLVLDQKTAEVEEKRS